MTPKSNFGGVNRRFQANAPKNTLKLSYVRIRHRFHSNCGTAIKSTKYSLFMGGPCTRPINPRRWRLPFKNPIILPYLRSHSADLDEIWHADAYGPSKPYWLQIGLRCLVWSLCRNSAKRILGENGHCGEEMTGNGFLHSRACPPIPMQ